MDKHLKLEDLNHEKIKLKQAKENIDVYFKPDKYQSYILNEIVRNSKACYPDIVGKVSELVPQNTEKTQKEWEDWYFERYPNAIETATDKAYDMLLKHKEAMDAIDRDVVKKYISDLVLVKSRKGLITQEMVLEYLSKKYNTTYRLATPEEESQGIDGYIGEKPIQVKPHTYLNKPRLQEEFPCDVVFYKDTKSYLHIYFEE